MRRGMSAAVVAVALMAALPARAAPPKPLVDQVREAIDRAVQYVRDQEAGKGDWEHVHPGLNMGFPGGVTSLAMLALLNSGVPPEDPVIQRGLIYLRGLKPEKTYVVGLQTMVFQAAGEPADKGRIQRNAAWLLENRKLGDTGQLLGWGYGAGETRIRGPDNSNTQYALLGLHEARLGGAKIDAEAWRLIRDYYVRTQSTGGGWGYHSGDGGVLTAASFTMSVAGLCGLLIAGMDLNDGRETIRPDGTASNCGVYEENQPVARALAFVGARFILDDRHAPFYNLYGLERAGRLTGQRFLGSHDWYREGCEFLIRTQSPEGFWKGHQLDDETLVATSFALLFLSKGRTPVVISKLVHEPGEDWNNDHNDARNLADFASRELFKRQPLAWQVFDAKRGFIENTRDELMGLVGDLLQSPVAYLNGHRAPRFTHAEEDLLKEYVDQGGFILAEACCGRPEFDRGFRALMARLFPDTPLRPLDASHNIWHVHFGVPPGSFGLEGIQRGCKTVVVYSPQDMSCQWESNQTSSGRAQLAFRLGANIIAYATGMEPPKPRLTAAQVIRDDTETRTVPRGYLKVAQLRHEGDWQPAPKAMPNLMHHLQDNLRQQVALKPELLSPGQDAVLDFKFLYMHGRNAFDLGHDAKALANVRANLQTGGLLLADACCGKQPFDSSFRAFIAQVFPDKKLERIPLTDDLFSKELNRAPLTAVRCRREPAGGGDGGYREVEPYLEGIRLNNRWVVIYSKYDLGCALQRHQSPDCLGHDYDSAVRIGTAAVLYALNR